MLTVVSVSNATDRGAHTSFGYLTSKIVSSFLPRKHRALRCLHSPLLKSTREVPNHMYTANEAHGDLIRLNLAGTGGEDRLQPIRVRTPKIQGGIDEKTLRDLQFRHPWTLPIPVIGAAYDGAIPVCPELSTPAARVDALYVNALGHLTLAEFSSGAARRRAGKSSARSWTIRMIGVCIRPTSR